MATVPFLINGQDVVADATFAVADAASGRPLYRASSAGAADVAAAVAAAAAALPAWRGRAAAARAAVLQRAAAVLERRAGELAGYMRAETGATAAWAALNVATAARLLRDAAARAGAMDGTRGTVLPCDEEGEGGSALVLREPLGVVAAVAPWNAPYILGVRAVAYPLAAGNTVVLKGAERAPRTMWAVGSVVAEAVAAVAAENAAAGAGAGAGAESGAGAGAGSEIPAGILNVIYTGDRAAAPAVTEALIAHPAVRKINFTGSTAVGRTIGRLAGEHLKPVLLELGGKASAVVWRDADLDRAAAACAVGAFLNAGQVCMSTERIVVHADVAEAFVAKLGENMRRLYGADDESGDADETGLLLIDAAAAARVRALVADAVAQGARVVVGRLAPESPSSSSSPSPRMRPVVVAGVTPAMALYDTETFGPAVCLFTVDSEAAALRLANDTAYGLTAAVFTDDLRRGLRMARALDAGAVHINRMTVHDEPALPHGGVKASGFGRFNGGLDEWVRTKTVTYV